MTYVEHAREPSQAPRGGGTRSEKREREGCEGRDMREWLERRKKERIIR